MSNRSKVMCQVVMINLLFVKVLKCVQLKIQWQKKFRMGFMQRTEKCLIRWIATILSCLENCLSWEYGVIIQDKYRECLVKLLRSVIRGISSMKEKVRGVNLYPNMDKKNRTNGKVMDGKVEWQVPNVCWIDGPWVKHM